MPLLPRKAVLAVAAVTDIALNAPKRHQDLGQPYALRAGQRTEPAPGEQMGNPIAVEARGRFKQPARLRCPHGNGHLNGAAYLDYGLPAPFQAAFPPSGLSGPPSGSLGSAASPASAGLVITTIPASVPIALYVTGPGLVVRVVVHDQRWHRGAG